MKVGHDGKSYFCVMCGKASFKSEMAARGHLGTCRGKKRNILNVKLAGIPAAAPAAAPAVLAAQAAAPAAQAAAGAAAQVAEQTVNYLVAQNAVAIEKIERLEENQRRMEENEIPHMAAVGNFKGNEIDWGKVVGFGVTCFALGYIACQILEGDKGKGEGKSKGKEMAGRIAEKAANRMLGKLIW